MPSLEELKLWVPLHFSKWELVLHEAGKDRHLSGKWFLLLSFFSVQHKLYQVFEEPRHSREELKGKHFLGHR